MLYGFYEYFSDGKAVILIYQYDVDSLIRVRSGDQNAFDIYAKKILLDHNSKIKFKKMPRTLNLTRSQLEDWTSDNVNDITKIAIKHIFKKDISERL